MARTLAPTLVTAGLTASSSPRPVQLRATERKVRLEIRRGGGHHGAVATYRDIVEDIHDRLDQVGLVPPVRDVEQRGGGWLHDGSD
jgi:hypothetical protein